MQRRGFQDPFEPGGLEISWDIKDTTVAARQENECV